MFKVLVIAYYFPPLGLSGVQRTLKFTKYFTQFNWQPTVITTGKISYFAHDESLLKEAENSNVRILRTESITPASLFVKKNTVKMPSSFIQGLFARISKTFFIPDNKIFWAKKSAKFARKILKEEKFDAIFITIPPFSSAVTFSKLKAKFDIPIIVDYRDAWLTNQYRFYPTPLHRYLHKIFEDKVLRKTDRIIAVNRNIKEELLINYPFLKFRDIDIIPHGFDPDDFAKIHPFPRETEKMIILYSGSFYEGITPKYLLQAFKKLTIDQPDIAANIEIHFIGQFKRENQKLVEKLKLEKFVKEIGYLTHLETLSRIISSDILWIMLPKGNRMYNVTPGKIFEYFATKKPIIANLPEGISKSLILEYGASFVTEPQNIEEIKNVLIKSHDLFVEKILPKPDEEFIDKFDRVKLTEQLVKIFQFYLKTE
ncbi:MAG: glycosyltransferase [Ignavibacteriae bacterium]|nr:glycosyltransferase [Ignavibacteriota bacterium]